MTITPEEQSQGEQPQSATTGTAEGSTRADGFVSSLPNVNTSTGNDETYARAAMAVMLCGFAAAVIATVLSQMSDNPLDQSTQLSLGITGLAAVVLGGVIFLRYSLGRLLRFWLLRMLHEQHRSSTDPDPSDHVKGS